MTLKELKKQVAEAKKQRKEDIISPWEQRFLVALAQDRYYRAKEGFLESCADKYGRG